MIDLHWIDKDGHECVTQFRTKDEAMRCAERLRGVQGLQLLDDDGEHLITEEA